MADDDETLETVIAEQPTVDVATTKGRNKQERELEQRERERREFWQTTLNTVVGRREIWSLLEACHPFAINLGAGPTGFPDPLASFKALGEQMIGLNWFLRMQQLDPVGVQAMLNENDPRFKKPPTRSRTKKSDQ